MTNNDIKHIIQLNNENDNDNDNEGKGDVQQQLNAMGRPTKLQRVTLSTVARSDNNGSGSDDDDGMASQAAVPPSITRSGSISTATLATGRITNNTSLTSNGHLHPAFVESRRKSVSLSSNGVHGIFTSVATSSSMSMNGLLSRMSADIRGVVLRSLWINDIVRLITLCRSDHILTKHYISVASVLYYYNKSMIIPSHYYYYPRKIKFAWIESHAPAPTPSVDAIRILINNNHASLTRLALSGTCQTLWSPSLLDHMLACGVTKLTQLSLWRDPDVMFNVELRLPWSASVVALAKANPNLQNIAFDGNVICFLSAIQSLQVDARYRW
jgi:hypothetical protein